MKLLEIAPNFVNSQAGTLMTILQHLEDKAGKVTKVPLSAVAKLMHNVGYTFSYDDLKYIYDNNPRIQDLISNFNQNEIVIGTPAEDEATSNNQSDATKVVDKLAKSAAKEINK